MFMIKSVQKQGPTNFLCTKFTKNLSHDWFSETWSINSWFFDSFKPPCWISDFRLQTSKVFLLPATQDVIRLAVAKQPICLNTVVVLFEDVNLASVSFAWLTSQQFINLYTHLLKELLIFLKSSQSNHIMSIDEHIILSRLGQLHYVH